MAKKTQKQSIEEKLDQILDHVQQKPQNKDILLGFFIGISSIVLLFTVVGLISVLKG